LTAHLAHINKTTGTCNEQKNEME